MSPIAPTPGAGGPFCYPTRGVEPRQTVAPGSKQHLLFPAVTRSRSSDTSFDAKFVTAN
jgi:hypothetical protein